MAAIEVTSNIGASHLDALIKMVANSSDRLIIVSPFLAADMSDLLSRFQFSGLKRVDLVTTVKPKDPEQLTKPPVILQFMNHFRENYPGVVAKVHVDNELHGKVYISWQDASASMVVSSANFTRSGMTDNHEWGIKTTEIETIQAVMKEVFEAIEYEDISYHQILRACEFAKWYLEKHPDWVEKPKVVSDILETVYNAEDQNNSSPKYFLKPLGTSENPVLLEEKRDFSGLHQNLYFSKKKPKGVKKGDVVITTAVGPGSLLSYFKVTGGLSQVTESDLARSPWLERWPWYMEGKNQSPKFGREWWSHNIRRQDALEEFLRLHPGVPVTDNGGFSLGTINFGGDKVQLTKEFAQFLIDKIESAQRVGA